MRLLLLLSLTAAHANPLDAFGFGARGMALSAGTAISEDFSANYYNPGGLAAGEDFRIELGYALVSPSLELNGRDLEVDDSRGVQGGVVLPGELFGHNLGFSIGVHLPDERVSRIRALPQRQPRWVLYDNRPQRIVISSSGAFEIIEGLYLGGGLTYLANTSGTLEMKGDVDFANAEQTELFSAVDVNLAAVRYWTVGALFERGDWRVGLTWRQEFSLRLDLDVDVRGRVVSRSNPEAEPSVIVPEGAFLLNSSNDNLYSPQQVFLGAAWGQGRWLLSLDLGWVQWSAFPTPTAEVTIGLELDPLDFDIPVPAEPEDPSFHDIFVPRAGVEFMALDGPRFGLALRGGYFYEPSPAPDQPGGTNYVDSDKHGASMGLGLRFSELSEVFPKPLHLDLAGQAVFLGERAYSKTDPADPVGDYVAAGYTLGFSTQLGLRF